MRLLLDECVTRRLKRDLIGHEARPLPKLVFRGLKNGALLSAASADFDVLITVDRNLPFQQNISRLQIAVVIVLSKGITYPDLKPMVPDLLSSLESIKRGALVTVEGAAKT